MAITNPQVHARSVLRHTQAPHLAQKALWN
jgi:hypothetical protein